MEVRFEVGKHYYVWGAEEPNNIEGFVKITHIDRFLEPTKKWKYDVRLEKSCKRAKLGKIRYLLYIRMPNYYDDTNITLEKCRLFSENTSTVYFMRASPEFIEKYHCPEFIEWFNYSMNNCMIKNVNTGENIKFDIINAVDVLEEN